MQLLIYRSGCCFNDTVKNPSCFKVSDNSQSRICTPLEELNKREVKRVPCFLGIEALVAIQNKFLGFGCSNRPSEI